MTAWKRSILFLFLGFLCLISALFGAVCFFLPFYLNSEPFSQTIRNAGFDGFAWDVRKIGVNGADIGSVRIGSEHAPAFSANVARLDYTPGGLIDKHVKRIFLGGIEFHCAYRDGRFSIRGLDLNRIKKRSSREENSAAASNGLDLPFSFDALDIQNAVVFLTLDENATYRIPLNARFSSKKGDETLVRGTVNLFPRNQKIALDLAMGSAGKTVHLKLTGDRFHPERFADIIRKVPGLSLAGELDLAAEGTFRLNPVEIESARAALEFRNTGSGFQTLQLQTADGEGKNVPPLCLEVRTKGGREWSVAVSGLVLRSPVPAGISSLEGLVERTPEGIAATGGFRLLLEPNGKDHVAPLQVTDPLDLGLVDLGLAFYGTYGDAGGWDFQVADVSSKVNPSRVWGVQVREGAIKAGKPELNMSGRGGPDGGTISYRVALPKPEMTGDIACKAAALDLKGEVRFGADGSINGSTELTGSKVTVKTADMEIEIPDFGVSGKWKPSEEGEVNFDGIGTLTKGRLRHPGSGTLASGIRARLPLRWPWAASSAKGEYSVAGVRWGDRRLGGLKGTLQREMDGLAFTGTFSAEPLPGAIVTFEGASGFLSAANRTEVRFEGGYAADTPMDLSKIIPGVQGVTMNGVLSLSGEMVSDPSGLHGSATTTLDNGNLWIKANDIAAEKIRLKLVMPELPVLRSEPAQELTVGRISAGKIRMEELRIQFQVESEKSVLLEKAGFGWCAGRVNAQALRISPGVDDYDVTLYCDRLNLADLLEQFGTARAAGEGTVNGRIPVRYTDGKFLFDDGFLYSTPGDGGTIRVTGADMLTAGIPGGTPQYDQIDLAREALKNYKYEWARIRMRTEGELLLLDLQFDGKPVDPLPFVYKEEAGGFVRMEAGGQVSRFQGIRLNVNLEMPLNKILQYKGIWDMIQ